MAFDYDKIKKQDQGDFWASYSDLFSVMSLIFLLLYVVSSIRSGTSNIQSHMEYQAIAQQRDDLQQQIKVYNTLKEDYLHHGASDDEQKMYEQLMDKLVLLKEEAGQEKENLRKLAEENEQKEEALNQYQQMVRNIINNNMISQARIKRRDRTIVKKNEVIKDNVAQIEDLNKTVKEKESAIKKGEKEIADTNKKLDIKIAQLQNAYKANRISKDKMNEQIQELKEESQAKVSQLQAINEKTKSELQEVTQVLQESNKELDQARQELQQQGSQIANLVEEKSKFTKQISNLQTQHQKQIESEKQKFESELAKQKLTAQQRAQRMAEFQKEAAAKERALSGQIKNLQAKAQEVQSNLDETLLAKNELEEKAQALEGEKQQLTKDVSKLKEMADAKKKAIQAIKENLAKSGLTADVDENTGDVVISFGREYFESGKAELKPGMEDVIKKFMPAYSKSLLQDPKVAEKVKSIEIVGFASPTYKGKYVNPVSLEASNRDAVNYNMDLSYYRARAIFDYVFDTSKIQYKHQKDILPMVKVTGRSFLAEGENAREISSMTNAEYCAKYDCKKSQRVMIKFNMEP
ncbi:MAG: hypothetical protein M9899_10450 [Bdellovibrionaceae bacterium]|nr:hypothetical protein [Pseudobdellovibrionaceae bacterium]